MSFQRVQDLDATETVDDATRVSAISWLGVATRGKNIYRAVMTAAAGKLAVQLGGEHAGDERSRDST